MALVLGMIGVGVQISETKDKAYEAFVKKFQKSTEEAYVTVGFHEGAGEYTDKRHAGVSVVQVALWNEFGADLPKSGSHRLWGSTTVGQIPERSFIRSTIDENIDKINQWRVEIITAMIFKGLSIQQGLESLGVKVQLLIQRKIKSCLMAS